jgi:hypothetical protein
VSFRVGLDTLGPTSDTAVACHKNVRETPRNGVVLDDTGRDEPARKPVLTCTDRDSVVRPNTANPRVQVPPPTPELNPHEIRESAGHGRKNLVGVHVVL